MKRIARAVAILGLAFVLAGFGGQDGFQRERGGRNDALKNSLEGKPPPELKGEWFNLEAAPTWASLKGKVVMIDFWAHWCGPCRAATPHIKDLLSKYGPKGLVVIAVHSDKNREKMLEVAKQLGMNWPVLFDPDSKVMKAFGGDSYPDYYFVDRKGVLRFADLANREIDRAVEMLIAEKA
jgi:thiol-disulfide isomerase/thioredoxin